MLGIGKITKCMVKGLVGSIMEMSLMVLTEKVNEVVMVDAILPMVTCMLVNGNQMPCQALDVTITMTANLLKDPF